MSERPPLVTLITGSRKGIGRHLAEHYVRSGHVVIGVSRSPADWSLSGYEHIAADVSDEAAVLRLFGHIRKKFGGLSHLINNAGVASMNHTLTTPLQSVRKVFDTNVVGTFLFCREAAKLMKPSHFGRIVNLATVATPLKLEGEAVYAASKAAVVTLTHIMAKEFAPFGITVNALGPTPTDTDLIRAVSEEKLKALLGKQAIPRMARLEDISNAVDFFLKPESEFITGQVLYLGGV